jgi:putative molybdopterin biosynthesis protein
LPDVDGIIARIGLSKSGVMVSPVADPTPGRRTIAGGCDPATTILGAQLGRFGFEVIAASCPSRCALERLKAGLIHIAGCHLNYTETDKYNLPFVNRLFKNVEVRVVTCVTCEHGQGVRHWNPKTIRSVKDLAHKNVRLINREKGSGAWQLLDRGLHEAGVSASRVSAYGIVARGHITAALAVSNSEADCCIATRWATRYFGLKFIPLASERYDFVVLKRYWDVPVVHAVFQELSRSKFRRKLETGSHRGL